jgi:endonuclease/exonuclease/phosphatase family metal-dependent hydrolase
MPALIALAPWLWFLVRDLSPRLDAVALLLPLLVLAGVVGSALGLIAGDRLWLVPLASWLVFGIATIVGPLAPEHGPAPVDAVRVGSANLAGRYLSRRSIGEAIAERDLDVVAVQELTQPVQADLSTRFAHGITTRRRRSDGARSDRRDFDWEVGVFSRYPVERLNPQPGVPGLRVRIRAPGRPFVLYALHVPKPDPYFDPDAVSFGEHRRAIDDLVDQVRAEREPVVMVGDLNTADRTSDYRRLRAVLDDAVLSSWGGPTAIRSLLYRAPVLRIDHVLYSPAWCARDGGRFDVPDSDHRGVQAEVGPCPPAE